jgi:hypothetical protein
MMPSLTKEINKQLKRDRVASLKAEKQPNNTDGIDESTHAANSQGF